MYRGLPKMFIPLHIIISVIMAIVITLFFEEPIRKKLKQLRDNRKKKRTENQSSHSGRRGIDNVSQSKGKGGGGGGGVGEI
jgi:peptidoglycan/LPS O-acetylase OafA/YrhL